MASIDKFTLYIVWVLASLLGALMGNQSAPQKWGLDLVFPVTLLLCLSRELLKGSGHNHKIKRIRAIFLIP